MLRVFFSIVNIFLVLFVFCNSPDLINFFLPRNQENVPQKCVMTTINFNTFTPFSVTGLLYINTIKNNPKTEECTPYSI
jgi:hypothetical protein